jgi:uncharacterized protein YndB with AHSA1/START domain
MSATRLTQHVRAPRSAVYRALLDAQAVATWMVPPGMTSEIHCFEAHEGGAFRISLTYDSPARAGKTSAQTDTFHGRFVTLVPDERVAEVVEFETDDPAMQGAMRITFDLVDAEMGRTSSPSTRIFLPASRPKTTSRVGGCPLPSSPRSSRAASAARPDPGQGPSIHWILAIHSTTRAWSC